MKLKPSQNLKHQCGLDFTNRTQEPIEFHKDLCPQCNEVIAPSQITGERTEYVKWVLRPPAGMTFKNEMGSEVTLTFEVGRELELFTYLEGQIQALKAQHTKSLERVKPTVSTVVAELLTQENILPPQGTGLHGDTPDEKNSRVLDQPGIQHLTFEDE